MVYLFSVLVNGSLLGFFQSFTGLRQGDPLSPYLFILALETLSRLLSRAKEGDFINGFLVRGKNVVGVEISHLLFVDNTLILCDASQENLEYLNWIFMWFEAYSGLKIKLEKSKLILVGDVPDMEELAEVLSYKVSSLPTTYLGFPLGAPYKSSRVWEGVEEHFQKRLAFWKRQYLSKGGRQFLIKSTLSSLLIYTMSLFVIPKMVRARLKKDSKRLSLGRGDFG